MPKFGNRITVTGKRWTTNDEGEKTQEVHYRFEETVMDLLGAIESVRSGHALLMDIEHYAGGGTVKIHPVLGAKRMACYSTLPLYLKGGKQVKEAVVEFSPKSFGEACSGVGTSPEEALFHELVHASQVIRARLDLSPIPKAPGMTNFAEFCAVTASNIFRSDLGRWNLRESHESRKAADTLTDSNDYYKFFRQEIDKWFGIQPTFCGHIAQMKIPFNPLRAKDDVRKLEEAADRRWTRPIFPLPNPFDPRKQPTGFMKKGPRGPVF